MASAEVTPTQADWAVGKPWPWLITGVASSGAALLLTRVLEADLSWFHFLLLGLGLAGMAAALRLRFRRGIDGGTIHHPQAVVLAFAGFNGLLAAGAAFLALFVLREQGFGWRALQALFFWSLAGTWFVLATVYFATHLSGPVSARMEGAVLLEFAALVPFLTAQVLDVPGRPGDWDSLRLFFAVLCLVFLVASALVAAARPLRRFLVSVLILVHFGGIVTAVMSSPPGPWLAGYLWERFYQPYLEFMYLQNAYRFYSPEPSPATQIWFFVEYEEAKEDKTLIHSRWIKVPDMDEGGTPRYAMRLRYQRMLALTENAAKVTGAEPIEFVDEHGIPRRAPYFRLRDSQSPEPLEARGVIGVKDPPLVLKRTVPYHPTMSILLQYTRPDFNSKQLLSSFARHVTGLPHPQHPGVKATSVKIYRVLHRTLDAATMGVLGEDPNSLTTYLPYYLGKYDPDGNLFKKFDRNGNLIEDEAQNPFLYWLLPTMPERMDPTEAHPESDVVRVYAILHAYGSEQAVQESGAKWKFRVLPSGRAIDFR
jgi:hypothetical protein